MADPVRIPGLFAGMIEPPFVRSREVEDLAKDVIASFDEFELIATAVRDAGLSIEYVWETKPFDPLKDEYRPHVIAKVTKANPLWQSLTDTHLVIQFRRWFWERFDDTQRRAVLHHELTHIEVDEPDDQGRIPISLRHHDVEDFTRTMRRFGPVVPGREAFVRAYVEWSSEHELEPGPVPDIAQAVGDAIEAAAAAGQFDDPKTGTTVTVTRTRSVRRRPPVDTFGGLVEQGEALEQALKRLERRADYAEVMGTDAGQRLLDAINDGGGSEVPWPTED